MFVVDSSQKHISLDYFGVVKAKYGVMLTKYNNIKKCTLLQGFNVRMIERYICMR